MAPEPGPISILEAGLTSIDFRNVLLITTTQGMRYNYFPRPFLSLTVAYEYRSRKLHYGCAIPFNKKLCNVIHQAGSNFM